MVVMRLKVNILIFTDTIRDITADPPDTPLTADEILEQIKTKIDDENITDLTVVQLGQSLELINDTTSFKLMLKVEELVLLSILSKMKSVMLQDFLLLV